MTDGSLQLPGHALTPEPLSDVCDICLSSKYYTGFMEIYTLLARQSKAKYINLSQMVLDTCVSTADSSPESLFCELQIYKNNFLVQIHLS